MFFELFIKECKQTLKSLTYYLIIICLFVFYFSQMGDFKVINKPVEYQTDYGYKYSDDEELILKESISRLAYDYARNDYKAYPIGFYKEVTLGGKKLDKMTKILEELLIDIDEPAILYQQFVDDIEQGDNTNIIYGGGKLDVRINENLSYERFVQLMGEVDDIIGGGSDYEPGDLQKNTRVPVTYEEALQSYEDIIYKDKLSNAYARLFSDYLGIILGLLPVFLAVTRALRDRRAQVDQVIYAKNISSTTIILTRYFSTVAMILLPVILLSVSPTLESVFYGNGLGVSIDALAYVKHIFGWLLPTILFVTALGFFFTVLTDSALGILVATLWWIISIFMASGNIVGNFGWNLIPRFNSLGKYDVFQKGFMQLVLNRSLYTVISLGIIIITIFIYSKKRRGEGNHGKKLFRAGKGKLS